MRRSKVLEKLRAGKAALFTNISLSPNPLACEIAGRVGYDGIWMDMEHRPFSQREVSVMINACRVADIDAMPRIRKDEGYAAFFRPLEDGASGIMVPHVKTGEEAEWVVRNAKFPPIGRRGMENVMPDADLGFVDSLEYIEHANRETFVMIQIEDAEALDHVDDIAGTEGVDCVFIGPADLSLSLGAPFQFDSPKYQEAERAIAAAVEKAGKWWGRPAADVEFAARYAEKGARIFNISGDYGLIKNGLLAIHKEFREKVDATL